MSEERRAAAVPNLNDVGEIASEAGAGLAPPAAPGGAPIDGEGRAVRPGARDSSPAARRRGRMTLRIPDDEVARPLESDLPPRVASIPAPSAPGAQAVTVTPMRIISIDSDLPPVPDDAASSSRVIARRDSVRPWSLAVQNIEDVDGPAGSEEVDVAALSSADSAEDPPTEPVLPSAPSTPRSLLSPEAEGEEVRFDEDASTPWVPGVETATAPDADRRSDPGDAPEISAEDLVAVEVAPSPARRPIDLPPMRARAQSQPSVSPLSLKPSSAISGRRPLVIVPPHVGNMGPQSADSVRRKGRLWWEELFNDDYVRTMEKLTDAQVTTEVDFIETSLGLEHGGAMLDLACGTGRQAIELARRGYEVVAFDLSLSMLARAGDDAQEREVKLNFVQGDMREMSFEGQFDGVYCWNTAFGYFDEEKNAQVVDRVHGALKAGGRFLLDVVNRDFILRQSPSLAWFEGDGCVCMDEMTVDFITSRMKIKRTLMLDDGRTREIECTVRVYSLHELGRILHEHGFKVCEVSGRTATPGVFFGNESPRTIILAEKR
jgi:SAM-dependent methyltransferase